MASAPPVIGVSGYPEFERFARAKGVVGFLRKPVAREVLAEAARAALAGKPIAEAVQQRNVDSATSVRRLADQERDRFLDRLRLQPLVFLLHGAQRLVGQRNRIAVPGMHRHRPE